MTLVDALFRHLMAIYSASFVNASLFWGKGLASFIVVGAILLAISARTGWFSALRRLPGHLFPPALYLDRTARITHWNFLLTVLIWGPLFTVLAFDTFKLTDSINAFLANQLGTQAPLVETSGAIVAAQTMVLVLSLSLPAYLVHLALHKIPVLWSIHRVHHSVEALTLNALTRTHPFEFVLNAIGITVGGAAVAGPIMYVFGLGKVSPTSIAIIAGLLSWRALHGIFEHGHIPISFGPLNRVFSGPILHQIHHSAEPQHRDKNMGGMFPLSIWDWMFGTLYLPKRGEVYRWGLNEAELGPNNPHPTLLAFYLEPFQHAWTVIKAGRWVRDVDVAVPQS